MYCNVCGAPIREMARFCGMCGAVVTGAPSSDYAGSVAPVFAYGVPRTRQLRFHATGGELFVVFLLNFLLTSLTLGIYYFWAKTKIRAFMAAATEFDGDRFAYHGTGKELLIGWLKAMGIFLLLVAVYAAIFFGLRAIDAPEEVSVAIPVLISYLIALFLTPFILVGAARYRLSRLSWRGIRFSFRGTAQEFTPMFVKGAVLTVITLGIYSPIFVTDILCYFVRNAWYGNSRFQFDGKGSDILGDYIIMILLLIPTLGTYTFWYRAKINRYYWDHAWFESLRFRSTVTGGSLLGLTFVNLLLTFFTLGIGYAWAVVRTANYFLSRLTIEGDFDFTKIKQEAQLAGAFGEELADAFDVDISI